MKDICHRNTCGTVWSRDGQRAVSSLLEYVVGGQGGCSVAALCLQQDVHCVAPAEADAAEQEVDDRLRAAALHHDHGDRLRTQDTMSSQAPLVASLPIGHYGRRVDNSNNISIEALLTGKTSAQQMATQFSSPMMSAGRAS